MGDRARAAKTERIYVRLTPEEKAAIERNAEAYGRTVSELVLLRCLEIRAGSVVPRAELRQIARELAAQGRNANQIAAAANRLALSGGADADPGRYEFLKALVDEVGPRWLAALEAAGSLMGRG